MTEPLTYDDACRFPAGCTFTDKDGRLCTWYGGAIGMHHMNMSIGRGYEPFQLVAAPPPERRPYPRRYNPTRSQLSNDIQSGVDLGWNACIDRIQRIPE